ncbi:hypothetical protein KH5H1_31740 [Corallococcus caeni]|nr:hypothetical protein KH5H1_31740 [Corallococcus sp. KH5-1]
MTAGTPEPCLDVPVTPPRAVPEGQGGSHSTRAVPLRPPRVLAVRANARVTVSLLKESSPNV